MATQGERMARIETKLEQNSVENTEIKATLSTISSKLDKAIECKADKTELQTLSRNSVSRVEVRAVYGVFGFLVLILTVAAFVLDK
jgi:hypothetical protein